MVRVELGLENRTVDGWTLVRVAGELDLHTAPQLQEHVLQLIQGDPVRIALDLTAVGFLDSSGLGALVTCQKRIREKEGRFLLVGVSGSPMKVFSLTGLDRVFELVASPDDLPSSTEPP